MKTEIETISELRSYLQNPDRDWQNVILQGLNLTGLDNEFAGETFVATTTFLGCSLGSIVAAKAGSAGAMVIPPRPGLHFDPFRGSVYRWSDLLDVYQSSTPDSYRQCKDWLCYEVAMNEATKKKRAELGADDELLFRLHDFAQEDALGDYLKPDLADVSTWKKVVSIMGGHDLPRLEKVANAQGQPTSVDAPYMRAALLAWQLTRGGYLIATGGGPGAMEAGNLGAFFGNRPENELRSAVKILERVPKVEPITVGSPRWNSGEWLAPAVEILTEFQGDVSKVAGESVGIPTWFYGHEPPNVFASHIAKYFENSLREEGLLAIATHGIVFAQGNAGTVQEIFQDACQNYYGTYGPPAPMILLDSAYWNRSGFGAVDPKHKPVWPLLQQLASERAKEGFPRAILLTDSIQETIEHIESLDAAKVAFLKANNSLA
ncbi:MAG: LOG family protein [Verrucomicrobiales bacterium]